MKVTKKTTIEALGAIVCQALKNQGIDAFLSGGAVVSIYTDNKYESFDLDFVSFADRKRIKIVMDGLGFSQDRSRLFTHPESRYLVEFPGTSVAIGDQPIEELAERKTDGNILKLLTPTDCIKDRLAAFIHWKDLQGFDQALMVARDQKLKPREIENFCKNEGAPEAYLHFMSKLKKILPK